MLVRSWNVFLGNASPPSRRGFLDDMLAVVTADRVDVVCLQEVPAWALRRLTVGDVGSRPPLGATLGRLLTAPHHGLMRGAVVGQGLGIWLGPDARLLGRHVAVLNPRRYRVERARELDLSRAARRFWAKERRIVQVVELVVGDRKVVVANLHCTPSAADRRIPDAEVVRAADFASSLAVRKDVLVLAGDFNVRAGSSEALRLLQANQWGPSGSWRGIDHVLVRGAPVGGLRIWPRDRRRSADGTLLSDHAPIEIDISVAS